MIVCAMALCDVLQTHVYIQTLWFMQSALTDLSANRESPSFAICQRVLHKCHEIIFGDHVHPSSSPYSGFILPSLTRRQKIRHHAEPVFIGIGVILAGAPVMPQLAEITGQVAIEQGRMEEEGDGVRSLEIDVHGSYYTSSSQNSPDDNDEPDSPVRTSEDNALQVQGQPSLIRASLSDLPSQPGALLSRRQTFGAQTLPALPLHLQTKRKPRLSEDPLGQLEALEPIVPYSSTPSLTSAKTPIRSASTHRADLLLERYDSKSQTFLLKGNYLLSEVSVFY